MEMELEVIQTRNKVFYAYSSTTIQDNLVVVANCPSNPKVCVTDQRLTPDKVFLSCPAYAFHNEPTVESNVLTDITQELKTVTPTICGLSFVHSTYISL